MTTHEINQAVAEYLGWENFKIFQRLDVNGVYNPTGWLFAYPPWDEDKLARQDVPNYTRDLNACRVFEDKLMNQVELYSRYVDNLLCLHTSFEDPPDDWSYSQKMSLICASAENRCKALLHTLGKLP